MPRGRNGVRESQSRIADEIEDAIRRDSRERARIDGGVQELAEDVRDSARLKSPVDHGDYAAAWEVTRLRRVDGLPARRVQNRNFKAHWIEYGTGDPLPTPEFAVARRTAAEFDGAIGPSDRAIPEVATPSAPSDAEYRGPTFVGGGDRSSTPERRAASNAKLADILSSIEDVD